MRILVFPAGMPEAQAFAREARKRGDSLVGASSVGEGGGVGYAAWERLPFITETDFADKLSFILDKYGIQGIFTPHLVIWQWLKDFPSLSASGVVLLGAHPVDEALGPYRDATRRIAEVAWYPDGLQHVVAAPPQWFQTALLQGLERVPGQCGAAKLALMARLVMEAHKGDIVEIGSLWGRSAYALALASFHADNGPVICVDPWQDAAYAQPESSPMLVPAAARLVGEEAYQCFLANLAPFAGKKCNYLRMPSGEAITVYANQQAVCSEAYGTTSITGRIALLHIDGNHDLEAVQDDLSLWAPLLIPGGWLVLDDYRWPLGDGPQRGGDAWLVENHSRIDVAFVAFDCLWARMLT